MAAGGMLIRVEPIRMRWRKRCRWLPKKSVRLLLKWRCFELEVWYTAGRGGYAWRLWRTDFPGRPPVVFPLVSSAVKKRNVGSSTPAADAPSHLAPIATKSMASFPNLIMHCSVTKYDDGTPRQPGWWTLKTQGSAWVLVLKDPDTASQMQCLGNTLDDALALGELLCGSDDAPWEPDPWARRQGQGKKK